MSRVGDKEKSQAPTGIELMTFCTPFARSQGPLTTKLLARETGGELRHSYSKHYRKQTNANIWT